MKAHSHGGKYMKQVDNNQTLLTEKEASRKSPFSIFWFQKKRQDGKGPPFIRIGRRVFYPELDLDEWFSSHKRHVNLIK